jgi:hypothetical protein
MVHVNMFHYFRIPYFTCTFFTKFIYNEYIGPYFLSHIVSKFFASEPPESSINLVVRVLIMDGLVWALCLL